MSLNIAIIGAVSAGKSTLLNALFADTYSDMKIKRTTMVPQVYICDNKSTDSKKIRELNTFKNNELLKADNITSITEMIHHVPQLFDFVKLPYDMVYTIYDIPGLNDAKTKQLYYNYIKENCYKFDIIIYMVDVNSAMNTSDEVEILKHVVESISMNHQNYGIYTYFYILVNKCDDMSIDKDKLVLFDEHKEMLDQVIKVVKDYIKPGIDCKIMPVSVEDWYIYRMCNKKNGMNLEDKYKSRLSLAIHGKKGKPITPAILYSLETKLRIVDFLSCAGFNNFKDNFKDLIDSYHGTFYLNHIKYDLKGMTVNYASADNLTKLDNYHQMLSNNSISTEAIVTAMIDYCNKFISLTRSYPNTDNKIKDVFISTQMIYNLSKRYKFAIEINSTQLQLISYFETKVKENILFSDFVEYFDKLQSLLANTDWKNVSDKLTGYFIYYIKNNNEYLKKIERKNNILDKFKELISKYHLKTTLIDVILTILTRYYTTITINSATGYQIRNYWNSHTLSYKEYDDTIKNLLFIKYYFNNASITSIDSFNDPAYDFYLEETFMIEITNSKYSHIIY